MLESQSGALKTQILA